MKKRAIALADRAASLSLGLLGALNMLFIVVFYFALLFAVAQGNAAEDIACKGGDMLARMATDDPTTLKAIRDEAATVENGSGLLWRIDLEGAAPSYLFGTMHVSDPRVVQLPDAAKAAFEQAGTVVIETTDILDQSKMMAAMLAQPDLMMFTDDTTLFSLMTPEDRAMVEAALSARGIPPASVAKMKPWMIASMVALPACELARKAAGAPVLDAMLAEQAKAAGREVAGLESAVDQLSAMASLPLDFHVQGLVDTLKLGDAMDDVIETMIILYLDGQTGMFWPFFREALPQSDTDGDGGFVDFEERMVTARNRTMAEGAQAFIRDGSAFIAVGALHLPGPDGVVSLLQKAGYSVEPVSTNDDPPIVGGDVDEHGCKGSAGYSWCAGTGKCERPWELARAKGFENSLEGFNAYCGQ